MNVEFVGEEIVLRLDTGEYKWVRPQPISDKDLIKTITNFRKIHGKQYVGAYNAYNFRIGNDSVSLFSNFSYEDIREMYGENVPTMMWGQKYDENNARWNKHFLTMGLMLRFGEGLTIGLANKEENDKIKYDFVLYALAVAFSSRTQDKKLKEKLTDIMKDIPEEKTKILTKIIGSIK